MSLADLSIKRPIFITCIVILMIAAGLLAMKRLGIDLFPNVTFPVVTVTTPYPGAGPSEIETLVSKPLEDEVATLSGIKRLSSISQEGVSTVIAEFTLETDVKFAEQQIRDRVSSTRRKLPADSKESIIRRIDPADQPIVILGVTADLQQADLYDLAAETIKTRLEQVPQVGLVEVIGGRKREIQVALDRNKLKASELSAGFVAQRLATAGENVPVGTLDGAETQTVLRAMGQFKTLKDIENTVLNLFGNDVPVTVKDVGSVIDTLADEKTKTRLNGTETLFVYVFRQSGANTLKVVDGIKKQLARINQDLESAPGKPKVDLIRDGSVWIKNNVDDVKESIFIGVILAVVVVYLFLANGRSTLITGLALPNSLIGAFILMSFAGFTINIMTLLALSLSVGLLVDDAIVVRENIFRHIEMGKAPSKAAREGTIEVTLAVIATTFTVIAVFGPVGFLKGVVGQFFKEFGLTICFAMAISLFDALTIAPMLSAYFAGRAHDSEKSKWYQATLGRVLGGFSRFQDWLEEKYASLLGFTIQKPMTVLGLSFLVFILSMASGKFVPKTFLPPQDAGEFNVAIDLPPGSSLEKMAEVATQVDTVIRKNREVEISALTIGGRDGAANVAETYVRLIPRKGRDLNTSEFKDKLREQLKQFAFANPKVKDYDAVAGGQRPFALNIVGDDQAVIEAFSQKVFDRLKQNPGLKDVDINFRPGKPEFQVIPSTQSLQQLVISTLALGVELRTQIEGTTPVRFRANGKEYDVRVRLKEDQRDLKSGFSSTYVPNLNGSMVRLNTVARGVETVGPSRVNRQDRARYVQVNADITPGAGLGDIMGEITRMFAEDPDLKLPAGVRYAFIGQAENFQELGESMVMAMGFGALFIFLVLASLYESFMTPFTIMLALPLAVCGSLVALAVTQESLNIFSMIGIIMLLGVATKNSILLVDYTNHLIREEGMERSQALIRAGRVRLRPILMTTMALIAGTLPTAMGLNEASAQRTSMGIAIIGGLISSTLLTLVVIPAAYSYIERFRIWSSQHLARLTGANT